MNDMDCIPRVKSNADGFPVIETAGGDISSASVELINSIARVNKVMGKLARAECCKIKSALGGGVGIDNIVDVNDSVAAVAKQMERFICGNTRAMRAVAGIVDTAVK
jgi:hypothetical protein